MQSYDMPVSAFEEYAKREREERLSKIHHQHLGDGRVRLREFFVGDRDRDMHEKMDARRAQMESAGATNFYRTKIGRNATCPCGSGLKFKKCCISKAT